MKERERVSKRLPVTKLAVGDKVVTHNGERTVINVRSERGTIFVTVDGLEGQVTLEYRPHVLVDARVTKGRRRVPSHSTAKQVVAGIRRALRAAGLPVHIVTGSYSEFGRNTQCADEGYRVHRVGMSRSVRVRYAECLTNGKAQELPAGRRRERDDHVRADNRIECDYED